MISCFKCSQCFPSTTILFKVEEFLVFFFSVWSERNIDFFFVLFCFVGRVACNLFFRFLSVLIMFFLVDGGSQTIFQVLYRRKLDAQSQICRDKSDTRQHLESSSFPSTSWVEHLVLLQTEWTQQQHITCCAYVLKATLWLRLTGLLLTQHTFKWQAIFTRCSCYEPKNSMLYSWTRSCFLYSLRSPVHDMDSCTKT